METPETPQSPEEETPQTPPKREIPEKAEPAPRAVHPDNLPEITLNADAKYFLYTAGRWAVFLGIMGFIITGLIAILAIFIGSIFSMMPRVPNMPFAASGIGTLMTFIYLGIAVYHFFFSFYLYQFGTKIKDGIAYLNELQVSIALGRLKSFFKLWGITTIVVITLYILMFIGFLIAIPLLKNSIPTNSNAYSFIMR